MPALRTIFRLVLAFAVAGVAAAVAPVASAQAPAVAFSSGDVTILRGAGRIAAPAGATLAAGDAIATGADGRAQLRFAGGTVVAISPASEVRIESLGDEPTLHLSRGALRAATPPADWPPSEWPLTGPTPRQVMQVETPQATIAVRGLHVQLAICASGACRESAGGAPSDAGLYGAVYDGSVIARAPSSTATFRQREFFVVPDGGAPRRLIGPPSFLSRAVVDLPLADAQALAFRKVPEAALDRYSALLDTVRYPYQSTEDIATGGPITAPVLGIVGSDEATIEFISNVTIGTLGIDPLGRLIAIDTGTLVASIGTASLVDTGSSVTGGASLNWGRWEGAGSTIAQRLPNGEVVHNDGGNLHYVYGVVASDLPTSGIVEYALVGGTQPTDSGSGATGSLVTGGRVAVNFNNAQVSVNGLQVGFANATYTMSGTANLVGPLFSTSGLGATGTCSGAACQPIVAANFAGFLAGPGAPGLGLDYYFNTRIGVIEGAAGYRRCAAPGNC